MPNLILSHMMWKYPIHGVGIRAQHLQTTAHCTMLVPFIVQDAIQLLLHSVFPNTHRQHFHNALCQQVLLL